MKALRKFILCMVILVSLIISNSPSTYADGETELPVFNTLSSGSVNKIRMSPDGSMLLTTGMPYTYLWNVGSGVDKKIDTLTNKLIYDAAFSPDGTKVAISVSGTIAGQILMLDSKSGDLINTISLKQDDQQAMSLSFTSDSKALIAAVRGNIKVINIESKAVILQFNTPDSVTIIKHNQQNDEVAVLISEYQRTPSETNSFAGNLKSTVQIRNEKTGDIIKTLSDFIPLASGSDGNSSMTYSQDGSYLVVSHSDGNKAETVVFNAKGGYQQVALIKEAGSISFSKDGKLMAVGNKVFPIDDKFDQSYSINVKNSSETINPNMSYITPDGKYLLYANDGVINLLDASTLSIRLTSIQVNSQNIAMSVNDRISLKLTGIYSDGTKKEIDPSKVKWSTQDFYVAEVKDSSLSSRSNGKTVLTANYGGLTTTAPVVVADAPSNLQATVEGKTIKLKWSAVKNTNDLLGYNVYRRTADGSYSTTPITDFPLQSTEYSDSNIDVRQDYFYISKAVYKNSVGSAQSNEAFVTFKAKQIILQVDNPKMKVNGESKEIDSGNGTTPVMYNGRTMLPIRSLIEELGGKLDWLDRERKITIQLNGTKIELWIDKETAIVNGTNKTLDVPPTIMNQRTMLPLRFITENLGCKLDWDGTTQTITLSYDGADKASNETPKKWYEKDYTQPVSSTFGKYIDGGVGFKINYPLAWGKPEVSESNNYGFGTYTTFYKDKIVKIIAYGNTVNGSYQDYLSEYQKRLSKDNYTPPATEITVKNAEKAYLIDLEPGMTNTISYVAFKNGEACHIEVTISSVGLSDELENVLNQVQEMMKTLDFDLAVG